MFTSLPIAHVSRGPGEAWGLLFTSLAAVLGVTAMILFDPSGGGPAHRGLAKGAAVLTGACVVLAYAFPLIVRSTWAANRPSSTARLEILSPLPGQVFQGDPVVVSIQLRLVGGTIVSSTTAKAVPNVGHIHVFLDGKPITLTLSLRDRLEVRPGIHKLEANFVAGDHGPFKPPVGASVSFAVTP
jgi:hypothetical protein